MSLPGEKYIDREKLIFDYKTLYFLANGKHLKEPLVYNNGWFVFDPGRSQMSYRLADFRLLMRELTRRWNDANNDEGSPMAVLEKDLERDTRPDRSRLG